jgi:RNA polymerase sigma-70 factor (ECF subfamily)
VSRTGRVAEPSDADLAARARGGEIFAFEALVHRHAHTAIAAAYRIIRDPALAEDAAQEAFLRVHRGLGGYEERSEFAAWLRRIAIRCAIDILRRRHPREISLASGNEPADGGSERRIEDRIRLEAALARLSPVDRGLLIALKAEGRAVAEVAQDFSMSETAVRVRTHRARARLRAILTEER